MSPTSEAYSLALLYLCIPDLDNFLAKRSSQPLPLVTVLGAPVWV